MDTIEKMEDAMRLFNAGDLTAAEAAARIVLEEEIDNPDAFYLLGLVEHKRRNFVEAEQLIKKAIRLEPTAPWFFVALAEVQAAKDDLAGAVDSIRQSIILKPDQPALFDVAAQLLNHLGRHAEHVQVWEAFTRVAPNNATAFNNLGTTLLRLHRAKEAIPAYRRAIEIDANLVDAHAGLAVALAELSLRDPAIEAAKRAVALAPEQAFPHYTDGIVFESFKLNDQSIESFARALEINPALLDAHERIAGLLASAGEIRAAKEHWDLLAARAPRNMISRSVVLANLNHLPELSTKDIFDAHKSWGDEVAEPYLAQNRVHSNTPLPNRRLRIGYLSGDLRYHAVALFLRPILQNHRDEQFEPICFSDARKPDEMTTVLQDLAEGWHAVAGKGALEIAETIRNEAIDILIDLGGHQNASLVEVSAYKPAPIMISYLGYVNTTGMRAIDYIVGDDMTDPPTDTQPYVEKILRLPDCFCCYAPLQSAPAVNELPALSRGGSVTLGGFHPPAKLNDRVLDLWSRILNEVPSATLLLRRDLLTDRVRNRLRGEFEQRGISPNRIIMRSDLPGENDKLKLSIYHDVDIALDAFPWSGHTSSCNSIWMGVPYITLRGHSHAGRMAASTITHGGFPQFVANSTDEYVSIVKSLASDIPKLSALRQSMRATMAASDLCDGAKFIVGWETALRDIWRTWCKSTTRTG